MTLKLGRSGDPSTRRPGPLVTLPVEVAGEAIAILAKRGAGKTNTAVVLVEEMHRNGIQFVVLDPVGVWWGLRSGTEGTKEGGLAIPVLGGAHGDVPLEPAAGELVADVVVETGQSVVVDVSEMSKTQQRSFVAAFSQRLYRAKGQSRSILHVVLEEADEFAPQRVSARDAPMVGAISQLVRRGRSRGIGMTMITQRSASLNKDVLDQADVLVAMRTTGPRDRKAIEGWIDHQDAEGVELVLPSLPNLRTGEAWVWNPERSMLERVVVRHRTTFDTSGTPGAGGKRNEPRSVAPIDLAALGKRIEETAEKAKQNDPAELRRQVRDLERRLSSAENQAVVETVEVEKVVEKIVEKPVFTAAERKLIERATKAMEKATEAFRLLEPVVKKFPADQGKLTVHLDEHGQAAHTEIPVSLTPPSHASETSGATKIIYPQKRPSRALGRVPRFPDMSAEKHVNGNVTGAQQKVLDALAWFEAVGVHHPSRAALAPLAGTRPTSGGFKNNLGALRTLGLIDYPQGGRVALTDEGRSAAIHPSIPPTDEALQDAIRGVLPNAQWRIVEALIDVYPADVPRETLAERVGVPATSGGFKNNLGALRTLELIDYPSPGWVRAEPILFPSQA